MAQTKASRALILALRRKRGESNMKMSELAEQTGVSEWTLRTILHSEGGKPTRPSTIEKLNQWLYERI